MITATVIGSRGLRAKLRSIASGLPVRSDNAAKIAAEYVAEYARGFVAVDTGKTKTSIRVERGSNSWLVIADRQGDASAVPVFLELGTRNMEARPFMQPAVDLVISTNAVGSEVRAIGGLLKV